MADRVQRVVLFPRFSALVGARVFRTQPLYVRDYSLARITLWTGSGLGTSPTIAAGVQWTQDLRSWVELPEILPSANAEVTEDYDLTYDWIRALLTLGGTDPVFNCWAVADLVARERS